MRRIEHWTPNLTDATSQRPTSRRSLLTRTAKTVSAGALAITLGGRTVAGGLAAPAASDEFADDVEVLTYLQGLEQMSQALYQSGLDRFAIDEDNENRPLPYYPTLQRMRDQERSHLESVTHAITARDGAPEAPEQAFDFLYDDFAGFFRTALEVEDVVIAAYVGAIQALTDPALRAEAAGILGIEARHAAYLRIRLGEQPFPDATEQGLSRDEVSAFMGQFVVIDRSS